MIGKMVSLASAFAFAFFKEAAAISEPMLDSLDCLLEDPQLLALSTQALASRSPRSNQAGREGIAPDRLLRCIVLKHIKGWSYRQLHRELRASLLYRRFTRFYEDPIPDFSNLCRAFALFGKQGTEQIHQRISKQASETTLMAGRKLRTDTTAVETNIHHPTDSSLLADSLRVMSRYLQRIGQGCQDSNLRIVNHARAAKHRVLEIGRAARTLTQAGQEQLKQSYKKLIGLTQRVRAQWMKRCQQPKIMLRAPACNCSSRSGNWRRWLFTDPYRRLIAGVEIRTAAATMAALNTVPTYT